MNTSNTSLSQRVWTFAMGFALSAYAAVFVVNGVAGFV